MKYIVVSGGVISGIGKGVTSSSIGVILKSKGYIVTHIKIDPYLNYSAGMMGPSEHGEVFLLNDGLECDLDLGNYERFSGIELTKNNVITGGNVLYNIIKKEMNGEYNGKTLQIDPHCSEEIINRIKKVAESKVYDVYSDTTVAPDFVIIELGGTVSDAESKMFLNAFYSFFSCLAPDDYIIVSVDFLVELHGTDHKTKPLQNAYLTLVSHGLKSDIIVCRAQNKLEQNVIQKISSKCRISSENIFLLPDLDSIYKVPAYLLANGLYDVIRKKMNLIDKIRNRLIFDKFESLVKRHLETVYIGIVAKYGNKCDLYASLVHSLLFSSAEVGVNVELIWVDAELLGQDSAFEIEQLKKCSGVVVPGGFGHRGIEGKIKAIQFCRVNKVPLLGICLGLQLIVIEFARNVLNLIDATSEEFDRKSQTCVISLLEVNGTKTKAIRCGSNKIKLTEDSKTKSIYGQEVVSERHRHRYGVNKNYLNILENNGLTCVGKSACDNFLEVFELKNHRFFIGVQYHPEFNSKPCRPSKLFSALIRESRK